MLRPEEWGREPVTPDDIQAVIDNIVAVATAFHIRRLKAANEQADSQARAVLYLQESVRQHTQIVRNWGYFLDVIKISEELYRPLNLDFQTNFGFDASDFINTAKSLVALLEQRTNAYFRLLSRVFRERKSAALIRTYYRSFSELGGSAEDFFKVIPKDAPRDMVAPLILAHASLKFEDLMTVEVHDVAERSGLSDEVTARVLNAISMAPGALICEEPEHLFMGNPIWQKPVIAMPDHYFCPIPQAVFSHIHRVVAFLAETASVKQKLEKIRSDFLEDKVALLLADALPSAKLKHGTKWRLNDVQYETDHVALIDKTVVIVEDKSGALSAPGLRGAPERVRRHINELIIDASEQSTRFEKLIWQAKAGDVSAKEVIDPFEMDFSDIEQVIRITVTLDDLSALASVENDLGEAGWLPGDLALVPTLNLADFQAVIHVLPSQAFFLHYFLERGRFQKALDLHGDELDLLGFYLETGFNVGDLERSGFRLVLTGMSASVDRYFNGRVAGITLPKPKPKLTSYFSALIAAIEERAFRRWTIAATDILRSSSYDEQNKIEHALLRVKRSVERDWRNSEHECSLIITPPAIRDTALVFYLYPPQLSSRRRDTSRELASKALDVSGRDKCVLICRDISRWNDPYAYVVMVSAQNKSRGHAIFGMTVLGGRLALAPDRNSFGG